MLCRSPTEEVPMPQILIVTDPPEDAAAAVVYRERILSTDLESDHFAGQLVERVGWAVRDAGLLEHEDERGVRRPPRRRT
jgi:hypothetical protein